MQEPEDAVPGPGSSPPAGGETGSGTRADAGTGARTGKAKRGNDGLVQVITWCGFLAYGANIAATIAIGDYFLPSYLAHFALFALTTGTLTLLIGFIAVLIAYFKAQWPDPRQRRRPLRVGIVLGAGVAAGIALMVVLVTFGGAGTRCVQAYGMTVVSDSRCQSSASDYKTGFTQWYRGGTGTQLGDHVRGGSVVPTGGGG
jgi:hypothetical protein